MLLLITLPALRIQSSAHSWESSGLDFNTLIRNVISVKRLPHTFMFNPTVTGIVKIRCYCDINCILPKRE